MTANDIPQRECEAIERRALAAFERARADGLRRPARVEFGVGAMERLTRLLPAAPPAVAALLTESAPYARDLEERARALLERAGFRVARVSVAAGEPTDETVRAAVTIARAARPAIVVAAGGGSVIDTGKAVAALAVNDGDVEEYLEGHDSPRALERDPLPCAAIPTTAGTGAEMTRNAVIGLPVQGVKRSLRDDRLVPRLAIVDPSLTVALPRGPTAAGGMDALTQLIESCISTKRKPPATALALAALPGVRRALPRCCETPGDLGARAAMSFAASASGVSLANAGLAMAHGYAAALGAAAGLPHGVACAILLPHALRYNRDACPDELAAALAAFLGTEERGAAAIDRGIAEIEALNARMGIPPDLKHLRLAPDRAERIADLAAGSSMSGNPVPLNADPDARRRFLAALV